MFSINTRKIATMALVGVFAAGVASAAMAETQWDKDHPRRDQVNDRVQNQNKRIHEEVKEGEMSNAKAAKLHREDRAIRKEERRMAARHDGHITKAEQAKLNRQENAVSKEIGR